jgi:hypothetical protein
MAETTEERLWLKYAADLKRASECFDDHGGDCYPDCRTTLRESRATLRAEIQRPLREVDELESRLRSPLKMQSVWSGTDGLWRATWVMPHGGTISCCPTQAGHLTEVEARLLAARAALHTEGGAS